MHVLVYARYDVCEKYVQYIYTCTEYIEHVSWIRLLQEAGSRVLLSADCGGPL